MHSRNSTANILTACRWLSTSTLCSSSVTTDSSISSNSETSSSSGEDEPGAQVAASTAIIPIRCPLQHLADDPLADLPPGTAHHEEAVLPDGNILRFEVGVFAPVSDGSCVARIGDMSVLSTVHAPRDHWKSVFGAQRLGVCWLVVC